MDLIIDKPYKVAWLSIPVILGFLFWGCAPKGPENEKAENTAGDTTSAEQVNAGEVINLVSYHPDGANIDSTYLETDAELISDFPLEEVETHFPDLDKDGRKDKITLSKFVDWSDPGDAQKLEVFLNGGGSLVLWNASGWVKFGENYPVPESLLGKNQLESDKIVLAEVSEGRRLLFLFGWIYANEAGLLTIVDPAKPELLFSRQFGIEEFSDRNKDGFKEIYGLLEYAENGQEAAWYGVDFRDEKLRVKVWK